jgi:hypothetical protein
MGKWLGRLACSDGRHVLEYGAVENKVGSKSVVMSGDASMHAYCYQPRRYGAIIATGFRFLELMKNAHAEACHTV